jgi:hypothetical protein
MKSERKNAPDNQVSREAAKSAKAAGLLRVFAPSREPLPQFRQRDSVVVHGKAAHFVTAVIDHSQPPQTGPCHSKNWLVRLSARG